MVPFKGLIFNSHKLSEAKIKKAIKEGENTFEVNKLVNFMELIQMFLRSEIIKKKTNELLTI